MAYLTNPVYLGVGFVDAASQQGVSRKVAWLQENHKAAYKALTQMGPEQLAALVRRLSTHLASLPRADLEVVKSLRTSLVRLDPRMVTGLGVEPISLTAKIANIAATIAALTAVTLGVVTFMDTRRDAKEQKKIQERQAAAAAAQASEEIAARKKALSDAKQAADAAESGVQLDAQGNPIAKKPSSPLASFAALAAAAGGAFLITK